MDDFDAKEAVDCYLKPHVHYSDLRLGEMFRFPGMQNKLVRVRGGYRREEGGPTYSTGKKTAVILLPRS